MPGLSPKLPLTIDPEDGFALNKTHVQLVKQNLKMLVLTSPGERLMIPDFGVGIRRYLFEQKSSDVYADIKSNISRQISKYMSFLKVNLIEIKDLDGELGLRDNGISIKISYEIVPLRLADSLEIDAFV